jgi:hypothetical protein
MLLIKTKKRKRDNSPLPSRSIKWLYINIIIVKVCEYAGQESTKNYLKALKIKKYKYLYTMYIKKRESNTKSTPTYKTPNQIRYLRTLDLTNIHEYTNLIKLTLCKIKNIKNIQLPNNLQTLIIDDCFNFQLHNNFLPNKLKQLHINSIHYNHELPILPDSLTYLKLGLNYIHELRVLPSSLEKLDFGMEYNHPFNTFFFKSSLRILKLSFSYTHELKPHVLNEGLSELYLEHVYNHEFKQNVLPSTLKILYLGSKYNQKIECGVLPNNLTTIVFGYQFDQELIPNAFPDSLRKIKFGHNFNKELLENCLPKFLTQLEFGTNFNKKININILPTTLLNLTLGDRYNKRILPDILNYGLRSITFGTDFDHPLYYYFPNQKIIPRTMRNITVTNYYKHNLKSFEKKGVKIKVIEMNSYRSH